MIVRTAVLLAFAAIALACDALPATAHTMIIPLQGKRARPIQAESLFHTLFADFSPQDDDTTYVQTGDIPAMWLRDSSAQTIPYVQFQRAFPVLRRRFAGVIARNVNAINIDVYANAFQDTYHVWERKWEVDSLAWPVLLTVVYWRQTGDRSVFTPDLHAALNQIVYTYRCEQQHLKCNRYRYPYRTYTDERYNEASGLIWGAFRPSDDAVQYRFNIPQNAIAAIALRSIADLALIGWNDRGLALHARAIERRVLYGIFLYGRYYNERRGQWMYAYETDGYGRYNMMDDANIPNLVALPYLNWCSAYDPTYLNTRSFSLSKNNPWYFSGTYAAGLGSPHTPYGFVWPLGIIGRALTTTSSNEVFTAVTSLAETDSEQGLIHESFYPNGYWRFTRAEFGWANALYADLLFRTLAGYTATPFVASGTMQPWEERSEVPRLVPPVLQLENAAQVNGTLEELLYAGRNAALSR